MAHLSNFDIFLQMINFPLRASGTVHKSKNELKIIKISDIWSKYPILYPTSNFSMINPGWKTRA